MIIHTVFFELRDPDLSKIQGLIEIIRRNVPGLFDIYFGAHMPNAFEGYNDRCGGYNFALSSRHEGSDALKRYTEHTDHVVLVTYLRSVMAKPPTCIDFEAPTPESAALTNSRM
jgi:hypothetical protein